MKKALVAYFSASGVAAGMAKKLANAVEADLKKWADSLSY